VRIGFAHRLLLDVLGDVEPAKADQLAMEITRTRMPSAHCFTAAPAMSSPCLAASLACAPVILAERASRHIKIIPAAP
jgi:hypothetical protein